ncbi:8-oxo-dGTP pyrophosphatase MutT, NUDIX family [Filomicrobium insigne]|uniref:8-oxo-dGTP pyrophosphatase MutT, NUDIX family n=1 Tax=Filomicrobium insigne TaxID=418854 RepID=A0A1H0PTR6_9HYPH|nr:CoA pyrophosphatase [Filomicrobium insigne]SDP08200.1 8-oxo-dGTP pyrophosphatase MutT, NUDIX family [Filomicrobium insigne]
MSTSTADSFTAADNFRQLAERVLFRDPPSIDEDSTAKPASLGDYDLNPGILPDPAQILPPKPAAVLIPILATTPLSVLLTVRSDHLPNHAGQISFPGGKLEERDAGPAAAAMREADEEIGLDPRFIEPVGFLDWYRTGSGYVISPLVALIKPGYTLKADPGEVTDIFEVPLPFLLDVANHQRHSRISRGRQKHFYAMTYGERYIWGATAGIIKNLHERLTDS